MIGWISDSYCSIKPSCSGMVEVVPARTSPTLLPHPLALCCDYPVSKCLSASIVVTSTVRVKCCSVICVVAAYIYSINSLSRYRYLSFPANYPNCSYHSTKKNNCILVHLQFILSKRKTHFDLLLWRPHTNASVFHPA